MRGLSSADRNTTQSNVRNGWANACIRIRSRTAQARRLSRSDSRQMPHCSMMNQNLYDHPTSDLPQIIDGLIHTRGKGVDHTSLNLPRPSAPTDNAKSPTTLQNFNSRKRIMKYRPG